MKKVFLIFFLAAAACISAMAQESQNVFNFLRIPISAHATALGGENISIIEDDATLALSNPALLSSVSSRTISLGYMNNFNGTSLYNAGYTHAINDKLTLGGQMFFMNYGSMKEMDAYGNELGTFSPSDLAVEAILSYTLTKRLVGGIGAKFVYSKIGNYSSTAAAIDLGLNYYDEDNDLSLSATAKNLGGQLSAYNDEFEDMPIDVLVGITKGLGTLPVRMSLTIDDFTHWDYSFWQHLRLGADIYFSQNFYVAGGYNFQRASAMTVSDGEDGTTTGGAGFTVGAGLLLDRFSINVSYAKQHVSTSNLMFNASFTL